MFDCLCEHMRYAYNKGNIRSAITVFKQKTEPGHDFRYPIQFSQIKFKYFLRNKMIKKGFGIHSFYLMQVIKLTKM